MPRSFRSAHGTQCSGPRSPAIAPHMPHKQQDLTPEAAKDPAAQPKTHITLHIPGCHVPWASPPTPASEGGTYVYAITKHFRRSEEKDVLLQLANGKLTVTVNESTTNTVLGTATVDELWGFAIGDNSWSSDREDLTPASQPEGAPPPATPVPKVRADAVQPGSQPCRYALLVPSTCLHEGHPDTTVQLEPTGPSSFAVFSAHRQLIVWREAPLTARNSTHQHRTRSHCTASHQHSPALHRPAWPCCPTHARSCAPATCPASASPCSAARCPRARTRPPPWRPQRPRLPQRRSCPPCSPSASCPQSSRRRPTWWSWP